MSLPVSGCLKETLSQLDSAGEPTHKDHESAQCCVARDEEVLVYTLCHSGFLHGMSPKHCAWPLLSWPYFPM